MISAIPKTSYHLKTHFTLYVLLALFVLLQIYRVNNLAPAPEYIWDNIYLWDWARNFGRLDFTTFIADSHHQLRWGNWGFAGILIKLFSDEVLIYYLATVIPSSLGIAVFIYYAWKHVGVIGALIFISLWHFDALLFRATFQLLPSGAALLPSAIMLILCSHLIKIEKPNTPIILAISVTMFWLYGTKETHLAFLPGVIWLIYTFAGWRALGVLLTVFISGYLAETVFFYAIDSGFSLLGRIDAVVNGGQHVKIMTESEHYVGQQTQYFDSGVTMRWMKTSGVTPVVLFLSFCLSLLTLAKHHGKKYSEQKVLAVLIASFFVCTTFFVISISPIRLGHGLVPRYATILLPFAYLLIILFIDDQLRDTPTRYKLAAIALIPFFIAPSIHRYSDYPNLSISEISNRYHDFGVKLQGYECARAKQKSIVMNQLDLTPFDIRTPNIQLMASKDENTIFKEGWFIAKTNLKKDCQSMFTITRNETMRY